jgi:hypothetical protein
LFKKVTLFLLLLISNIIVAAPSIVDNKSAIYSQSVVPKTIEVPRVLNVGVMDEDSPATYKLDGVYYGIALELFDEVAKNLGIKYNKISYHDHHTAIDDLKNNKLSVLLGAFTHDPNYEGMNIVHSPIYFIDEDMIISPKHDLSFKNVFDMIWTDLLQNTILFSFIVSILVWVLLLVFESSKHPDLKEKSLFDRLTYLFFQVWACFLRDLIYDPATNSGRILMSFWMFFSILMITVVTSIMTSTIIILNTKSHSFIKNAREMHFKNVGYLGGHHSSEYAITLVGGHAYPYEYISSLLQDISKSELDYAVVSKTMLEDYLSYKSELKKDIAISNVATGYEGWVFLYNKDDKVYYDINTEMVHVVEKGDLYSICSKYMSHPEHCLVM